MTPHNPVLGFALAGAMMLAIPVVTPAWAAPQPLSSIAHPPSKISTAEVVAADGTIVGAVQRIDTTPEGMPIRLWVALTGKDDMSAGMDAGSVRYDPDANRIQADDSPEQIRAKAKSG